MLMVGQGGRIGIEYSVFLDDGTRVDTNVGGELLVFERGADEILPALEEALAEVAVGESTRVTLDPEQAYGPVLQEALREVSTDLIPANARRPGAVLIAEDDAGNRREGRVVEVRDRVTVVDLNHPLAGRTLTFEVTVVQVG